MTLKKLVVALLLLAALLPAAGCPLTGSRPPATPHESGGEYAECSSCHEGGAGGAPVTDHPRKDDCLSCHPPSTGR